jgi:hypothetical protein
MLVIVRVAVVVRMIVQVRVLVPIAVNVNVSVRMRVALSAGARLAWFAEDHSPKLFPSILDRGAHMTLLYHDVDGGACATAWRHRSASRGR